MFSLPNSLIKLRSMRRDLNKKFFCASIWSISYWMRTNAQTNGGVRELFVLIIVFRLYDSND